MLFTFLFNDIFFFYLQVTMTGDYILSIASILIARLKNDDVTIVLSEVSYSKTSKF